MSTRPISSQSISIEQSPTLAENIAEAMRVLYESVKARKIKEMIEEIQNGGKKNGECQTI